MRAHLAKGIASSCSGRIALVATNLKRHLQAPVDFSRIVVPQGYCWALIVGLFFIAVVKTAWVSEDAFITFRTVGNVLDGLGLTWNPVERVQAFTHPLWLAFLVLFTAFSGDPYWTSLGLSVAALAALLVLLGKVWGRWDLSAFLAAASLLWCHSFIDYSTSGLENPLTHVLLAAYALVWFRGGRRWRTAILALVVSLLFLTRPDAILLVAPSLAWHCWTTRHRLAEVGAGLFWGFLPAVGWVAFSVFYYGAPVPNTALAKVQTGLTLVENARQAIDYFSWTLQRDLVTVILMLVAMIGGFWDSRLRLFSIGIGIWCAYLFYIGADYMGGRFFSGPAVLASILICFQLRKYGKKARVALAIFLLFSFSALSTTLFSPSAFDRRTISAEGIADERGFYYQQLGAIPALHRGGWFSHPWLVQGRELKNRPGVYTRCAIGMTGFAGGPSLYWVDPLALTEPFLARLPARTGSRIGHYERALPKGYLESTMAHKNLIADPALRRLYEDVDLATRAPLGAPGRLAAIWRLNVQKRTYASSSFDKQAVGLPGVEVKSNSKFSCYGVPYGGDGIWKIDGPPVRVQKVALIPNPRSQLASRPVNSAARRDSFRGSR